MLQAPLPPNGNKSGRMGSAHSNHSFILNPRAQKKSKAAIRGLSFASRCTHVSLFLLFFLVLEYIERAELRRNAQHAELKCSAMSPSVLSSKIKKKKN